MHPYLTGTLIDSDGDVDVADTGAMPVWPELVELSVDGNLLTGGVPGFLGALPKLAVLSARRNSLNGTLEALTTAW